MFNVSGIHARVVVRDSYVFPPNVLLKNMQTKYLQFSNRYWRNYAIYT